MGQGVIEGTNSEDEGIWSTGEKAQTAGKQRNPTKTWRNRGKNHFGSGGRVEEETEYF